MPPYPPSARKLTHFLKLAMLLTVVSVALGSPAAETSLAGQSAPSATAAAIEAAAGVGPQQEVSLLDRATVEPLALGPERLAAAQLATVPGSPALRPRFITIPPVVTTPIADPTLQVRAAPVAPAAPAAAPVQPQAPAYAGVQRLWIPELGIDSGWGYYGCADGTQESMPNGAFVWTCSGANNIYMVSHNGSTFYPLWSAYHNGALRLGMTAVFADAAGNISHWQLISATDMEKNTEMYDRWSETGGDSATPVLTMQTCWDPPYHPPTRNIIVRWALGH